MRLFGIRVRIPMHTSISNLFGMRMHNFNLFGTEALFLLLEEEPLLILRVEVIDTNVEGGIKVIMMK